MLIFSVSDKGVIIINAITEIFPVLLKGLKITLTVLVLSAILAYFFAFITGLLRSSKYLIIRFFPSIYVEVFRGTSLIVQLFWFYYAFPMLFNIQLGNDLIAGVLAISLNYGAYMSEVVRTSIITVDKGQTEAATALNMTYLQRLRLVILPQAVRMMLPEFGNYLIQMLKATSLVSLIGMTDILYHGNILRSTNLSMAPTIYIVVLVFFFILALPLIFLTRKMEKFSKKGVASS